MLRLFLTLILLKLGEGTETSAIPPVTLEGHRQLTENQPADDNLSPCCVDRQPFCERKGKECEDFIMAPYLLHNCRCVLPIPTHYQRLRQQCRREAIEFAMERMEIRESRVILRNLPNQNNDIYPGPAAEVGAKGPQGRGKVPLSEAYLQKKLEKLQKENANNPNSSPGPNTVERDVNTGNSLLNGNGNHFGTNFDNAGNILDNLPFMQK